MWLADLFTRFAPPGEELGGIQLLTDEDESMPLRWLMHEALWVSGDGTETEGKRGRHPLAVAIALQKPGWVTAIVDMLVETENLGDLLYRIPTLRADIDDLFESGFGQQAVMLLSEGGVRNVPCLVPGPVVGVPLLDPRESPSYGCTDELSACATYCELNEGIRVQNTLLQNDGLDRPDPRAPPRYQPNDKLTYMPLRLEELTQLLVDSTSFTAKSKKSQKLLANQNSAVWSVGSETDTFENVNPVFDDENNDQDKSKKNWTHKKGDTVIRKKDFNRGVISLVDETQNACVITVKDSLAQVECKDVWLLQQDKTWSKISEKKNYKHTSPT
jgi:hypothetical protein